MQGYVYGIDRCFGCGKIVYFNPLSVPSIMNRPVCRECIAIANPRRVANGLPEIVPADDAYDPLEEGCL